MEKVISFVLLFILAVVVFRLWPLVILYNWSVCSLEPSMLEFLILGMGVLSVVASFRGDK